jgi:hypothetical protein
MTERRSKDIFIAMWSYFVAASSAKTKKDLPRELYSQVKDLKYQCPFCDTFFKKIDNVVSCDGCPIDGDCIPGKKLYTCWVNAKTDLARGRAARATLEAELHWEPRP